MNELSKPTEEYSLDDWDEWFQKALHLNNLTFLKILFFAFFNCINKHEFLNKIHQNE